MAKTYTALTPGNATAGNAILASDHATAFTNINNMRVPPCCIQERTGLVVADGGNAAVAFTSAASVDTEAPSDPMHSTSSNNSRITIRTSGIYLVSANLQPTAGALANVAFTSELRKNGTAFDATAGFANSYINSALSNCAVINLAASDYVELWYYNDNLSGTSITLTARLRVAWLGQAS